MKIYMYLGIYQNVNQSFVEYNYILLQYRTCLHD